MIQLDAAHLLITCIGLIVWFARLEFKTINNEKNIEKIEVKHETFESKVLDKLSTVEQSLSRIEGQLSK